MKKRNIEARRRELRQLRAALATKEAFTTCEKRTYPLIVRSARGTRQSTHK